MHIKKRPDVNFLELYLCRRVVFSNYLENQCNSTLEKRFLLTSEFTI